ncbi:alpha-amylase family glycosyl hydrolase [Pirellulaceae bacterium SH467]
MKNAVAETISGLGCQRVDKGYRFAVWAPHADHVSVIGDFNAWNIDANPCKMEDQGVWVVEIPEATVGQGYKFSIRRGEERFDRIDPRAREVSNSVGHTCIVEDDFDWEGTEFTMPPWNELVIYELHIGTFHTMEGQVGTFDSAIEKLPFLKELGINAIELMPLAEFAGDISWGYNPAHPFAVESAYGGVNGLKRFIRAAHKLGIAVIIDVVYNHFGPSDLDLWRFDGWSENDKGGIYFYNDWRSATPWGDTRPDYGRQEVRQYIFDNAMMWLDEFRADGLRYDMTLYIRAADHDQNNINEDGYSLLQWINTEVANRFPGRITIAEDLQNNSRLTESAEHGGGSFDAQWDAAFVHPVREAITAVEDAHRSLQAICDAILHKYNHDVFERVIYTESHDEVANGKQRVVSEIDPSETPNRYAVKQSTLGACLMMTAPGIPMLFQGQEFLVDQWFRDTVPIDWSRAEQYDSIVRMYRDLIALRANRSQLTAGLTGQKVQILHCNEDEKVIAFHRSKEGGPHDDVVVVLKFSDQATRDYRIGFPTPGHWKLVFNGDAEVYGEHQDGTQAEGIDTEAIAYDHQGQSANVHLGAYSCLIYTLESVSTAEDPA